jgi:hypothetical protein
MAFNPRLEPARRSLWIGFGLIPLLAGLDKFFNLLTNWEMYLNPLIPRISHLSAPAFMHIVGIIEIAAGILMFTRFTRYAAYIVMLWLWAISLNLIMMGRFFDIAVRDIAISLGAFALAKLTEVRETSTAAEAPRLTSAYGEPASRAA